MGVQEHIVSDGDSKLSLLIREGGEKDTSLRAAHGHQQLLQEPGAVSLARILPSLWVLPTK